MHVWKYLRGAAFVASACLAFSPTGCSSTSSTEGRLSGGDSAGVTSSGGTSSGGGICSADTTFKKFAQSSIDKVDLLLAIDNSRSMADKQQILNLAVPDLVNRFVNPICVDATTFLPATQPMSPTDACPNGSVRAFAPILDIHIGVVDSSLGAHGGDACPDSYVDANDCPIGSMVNTTNNDHGHLVIRKDPCGPDEVPTYQGLGFLAWDPDMMDNPPGESNITALGQSFADLVNGVGQIGCGFESQEEGWFRFLVDPAPYQSISVMDGNAVKTGTDQVLLKQRSDFLRPDSLLSIVLLTDENDCSAIEGGQYYILEQLAGANGQYHLPPARAECSNNPNDPCCLSCAQTVQATALGCPADPSCSTPLDSLSDSASLRCFDDKRRFGIDFLYPWQRYVNALTQPLINPNTADLSLGNMSGVPNPIFSVLQPNNPSATIRTPDMVFLTGIVGVPWQDIAEDPTDLTKGYKTAKQLGTPNASGQTGWDIILGDPDKLKPPADPFMLEQIDPRMTGAKNPITGDAIAAPSSPNGTSNINGHEWTITARDDLQYACIFPIPMPRDCSMGQASCDCFADEVDADNPLCDPNPNDAMLPTLQTRAKGYPGIRHLQILKGLGDQGIVASVCAKQVSDPSALDFGYRPAIGAIVDRLTPKFGGQCLPFTLTAQPDGQFACVIAEATVSAGTCVCDPSKARAPVAPGDSCLLQGVMADPSYVSGGYNCICEIPQATGDDLKACQNDASATPVDDGHAASGWCYIDATTSPPIGNPALVAECPITEKRTLRYVGPSAIIGNALTFLACSQ